MTSVLVIAGVAAVAFAIPFVIYEIALWIEWALRPLRDRRYGKGHWL
jgi:hypothetical protein